MQDPADFKPIPGVLTEIAPQIRRIVANNPSPMTFRGTNTYVVGQGSVAVIDPGPDDPAHMAALLAGLSGETISHILVTHAHLDHSPLARALAKHSGAPVLAFGKAEAGRSPQMQALADQGLAGGGEGVDHGFEPDLRLAEGAVVNGETWALTARHTPGHMASHMSFSMGDTVFCGDHVMDWSTTLVSPPDGDLGAFIATCQRMAGWDAALFLPGHGAPVNDPAARLANLVTHRIHRASQIASALSDTPHDIAKITAAVYTDLAPHLHPAAARNVFAHLIELVSQGKAKAVPNLSQRALFKRT